MMTLPKYGAIYSTCKFVIVSIFELVSYDLTQNWTNIELNYALRIYFMHQMLLKII